MLLHVLFFILFAHAHYTLGVKLYDHAPQVYYCMYVCYIVCLFVVL